MLEPLSLAGLAAPSNLLYSVYKDQIQEYVNIKNPLITNVANSNFNSGENVFKLGLQIKNSGVHGVFIRSFDLIQASESCKITEVSLKNLEGRARMESPPININEGYDLPIFVEPSDTAHISIAIVDKYYKKSSSFRKIEINYSIIGLSSGKKRSVFEVELVEIDSTNVFIASKP